MLVESMAGKSGALHGAFQDSSPFRFDEKDRAVEYFAEQLKTAGYNYYGSEVMYSGIHGIEVGARKKAINFSLLCYFVVP